VLLHREDASQMPKAKDNNKSKLADRIRRSLGTVTVAMKLHTLTKVAADDLRAKLAMTQQRYEDDLRELHRRQTMRVASKVAADHKASLLIKSSRSQPKESIADRTDKSPKVAVVTGAGRGLGLAVARGLCCTLPTNSIVILTCRNHRMGNEAVAQLKKEAISAKPMFHELDISDAEGVEAFRKHLQIEYQSQIDIVVHCASLKYSDDSDEPFEIQASELVRVNFFGTLRICDTLAPMLRPGGRMVLVSCANARAHIVNEEHQQFLLWKDLTEEQLVHYMTQFVIEVERDQWHENGWPPDACGISKLGLSLLCVLYHRHFAAMKMTEVKEVRALMRAEKHANAAKQRDNGSKVAAAAKGSTEAVVLASVMSPNSKAAGRAEELADSVEQFFLEDEAEEESSEEESDFEGEGDNPFDAGDAEADLFDLEEEESKKPTLSVPHKKSQEKQQYEAMSFVNRTDLAGESNWSKKRNKHAVREDILVNCCCPGEIGMALGEGEFADMDTVYEKAATTPVYLATLPWGTTTGGRFWIDRATAPWLPGPSE